MTANRQETVYGIHAVSHVLRAAAGRVTGMLALKDRSEGRVAVLIDQARSAGVSVRLVSADELARVCGGVHQGVALQLLAAEPWDEKRLLAHLADIELPLLLILDGVQDPHNLGACLRVADAAGADAVIVPRDRAVGLTATVRKVACGAAETMPLVRARNLARTMRALKEVGVWCVGTDAETGSDYAQADLTGRIAFVMGGEERGLRRLTRETCDLLVSLPMRGLVESLNVSVATGICLYEARRQRDRQ
ncbi:MAG: 23S rRNA (guanosine(2251)-2'-O)-methyltransferase RlmB [Gammaproteobacteria bacterium]|jgi:23S rRNA (guanosine2251-2'-O)-methyltransferase